MGKLVAALQKVGPSKNENVSSYSQLLSLEKILGICLSWLVQGEILWEFLALKSYRERVFSRIRQCHLSDLDCIIG